MPCLFKKVAGKFRSKGKEPSETVTKEAGAALVRTEQKRPALTVLPSRTSFDTASSLRSDLAPSQSHGNPSAPSSENVSIAPAADGETSPSPLSPSSPSTLPAESSATAKSADKTLWDQAYDNLAKSEAKLVTEYEDLLARDAGPQAPDQADADVPKDQTRKEQLDAIVDKGLQQAGEKKLTCTIAGHEFDLGDKIYKAADAILWAKDFIGDAAKASPEASAVWAGVCLVLPLLTALKTAAEANDSGFTYVTTRMRYYTALEPLLHKLGQNKGCDKSLVAEISENIVKLYEKILSFQIQSILRFYYSLAKGYAKDVMSQKKWKQMQLEIEQLETTIHSDLIQVGDLAARQELEQLNETARKSCEAMTGLLSISKQQLATARERLAVSQETRDIAQQQLQAQQAAALQALTDKEEECIRSFRLTSNNENTTYEWYKNSVPDRVENTCKWFLQHDDYQRWLRSPSGPLLVTADPGCGKSVLAKDLVDCALPESSSPGTTFCYFFFKDQDQNTACRALCAILHQLFSQNPSLVRHAMQVYKKEGLKLAGLKDALWTVFTEAVCDPAAGPVTVVLDALDECKNVDFEFLMKKVQRHFVEKNNTRLKVLMTSRPYDQIMEELQPLLDIFDDRIHIPGESESEMISEEVNYVIEYRVDELARRKRLPANVKAHLAKTMLAVQHRTYLWVHLIFDYLKTDLFKKTKRGIEAAISTLPKTVDDAYEQILARSKDDPRVRKILAIILAASRPLTVSEMNVAVNFEGDMRDLTGDLEDEDEDSDMEDDASFKDSLRSLCGLFVSVYDDSVHLIHLTAREFLLRKDEEHSLSSSSVQALSPSNPSSPGVPLWKQFITVREANRVLAELCIVYLSSSRNSAASRRGLFFHYARNFWPNHFRFAGYAAGSLAAQRAVDLLDRRILSDKILKTISGYFSYPNTEDDFSEDDFSKVNFSEDDFSEDDFSEVDFSEVDFSEVDFSEVDFCRDGLSHAGFSHDDMSHDEFSIMAASWLGLVSVVTMILCRETKGSDQISERGRALALVLAAKYGHVPVVRLLLDAGTSIEPLDPWPWDALREAIEANQEDVVEVLLQEIAKTRSISWPEKRALLAAIGRDQVQIVRLFLDAAARASEKEVLLGVEDGTSALVFSIAHARFSIAKMLLSAGAKINERDSEGYTPLLHAVGWWDRLKVSEVRGELLRYLIAAGACVDDVDERGASPLILATLYNSQQNVGILLDAGVDVNRAVRLAGDSHTTTALGVARAEDMAQYLLARGAKVDKDVVACALAKQWVGVFLYLLKLAASGRCSGPELDPSSVSLEDCAQFLRDANIDINRRGEHDSTILMRASNGDETRFLLGLGADPNCADLSGKTALCSAQTEDAARALLAAGADVNGATPFLRKTQQNAPITLEEAQVSVEVPNGLTTTPLMYAAGRANLPMVELLLQFGANPMAIDRYGDNALHHTIPYYFK